MKPINKAAGFSYAMVLVALVLVSVSAEVAISTTFRMVQADREAELLFRGMAYRRAIRNYYESGRPIKTYPRTLEDLLLDPRSHTWRHLRALYTDPMTPGQGKWAIIRAADGGIAGVASQSQAKPLKQANFPAGLESFAGAESYSQWQFVYFPSGKSNQLVN